MESTDRGEKLPYRAIIFIFSYFKSLYGIESNQEQSGYFLCLIYTHSASLSLTEIQLMTAGTARQ